MKKWIVSLFCFTLFLSLSACSTSAEIVLVTDAFGPEDGARNEALWEGVRLYAELNDKTSNYILPSGQSEEALLQAIERAVETGAQVVLLSGESFAFAAEQVAEQYPEVQFMLMDASAEENNAENWANVALSEEEAGYLAGATAVLEGERSLAFLGTGSAKHANAYGFGFVQGAADVAEELGEEVSLSYAYREDAQDIEGAITQAEAWFSDDVEVVFVYGEPLAQAVFDLAETYDAHCIAAETNQNALSPTVQTSAVKYWQSAAGQALDLFYEDSLAREENFGIAEGAVGLAMEGARFEAFTAEDYETLLQSFLAEEIEVEAVAEELSPQAALSLPQELNLQEV